MGLLFYAEIDFSFLIDFIGLKWTKCIYADVREGPQKRTTGIDTFCDKLIVFGDDFPRIGPESARSDFWDSRPDAWGGSGRRPSQVLCGPG